MKTLSRVLFMALLVLGGGSVFGAAVTAQLERDSIMVGESTTLTLKFDTKPERIGNFPQNPGLLIQYQGQSQNLTIINGQQEVSFNLNYLVTGRREGTYTIPAIAAMAGGSALSTQPLKITVTKNDLENAANRYAFIKLVAPKKEIYIGETIPIEVQLYVTQAEDVQQPTLESEGFVINKQAPYTKSRTQMGNQIYNVLSFKMAVSAAKEGDLTLGPAQASMTLLLQQQRGGDILSDFFGNYIRRPYTARSEAQKIHVLPLPPNPPAGFSGAVGSFSMSVEATPRALTAGDPITLRITLTGRGNLDNLKLPEFKWPNFKFYPPNSSVASNDPLGMEGTKSFEQVISPEAPSIKEIPPVEFSYFDPAFSNYRTLKEGAIAIQVAPGAAASAQPVVANNAQAQQEQPRDIVHIKLLPGELGMVAPPLITRPWFLALQGIPVLGLLGAGFWRRRQDRLANNPRLRRKIQVRQFVRESLAQLRTMAAENKSEEFFATLFRLLQEQLGERLDLPASAITEAVLDDDLPAKGAHLELIAELHSLFQLCNQARYAPVSTTAELTAVVVRAESAIVRLQELRD